MSVLIKGMKMPKSCSDCWALDDYGDYPRCRITEEQRGYNFPIRQERMDNCPLVPVPPHGRLIDAAELQKDIHEHDYVLADEWNSKDNGMFTNGIDYAISVAPTIIPASEEGE